jgi:hypothetical protein
MISGNNSYIEYKDVDGLDVELANAGSGDVKITAGGNVTDSGAITAEKLTVNTDLGAGGSIILDMDNVHDVDMVNLTSKKGHNIVYKDKDDVKLSDIWADTGSIFLKATNGEMTHEAGKTISAAGGSLTMKQAGALNLKDFTFVKQADTNIILESFNNSITIVNAMNGGKDENAADQWELIKATAQSDIVLKGIDHNRDIMIDSLHSISGTITANSRNQSIKANDKINSDEGSISFIANNGKIITKNASAMKGIKFEASDDITVKALATTLGNISLHSTNGNIIINSAVNADSIPDDSDGGGVELIADSGIIYTEDGLNDTLNAPITGFSDEGKGVMLPTLDATSKAAIVIRSKGDLKLGLGATLKAEGNYTTGVDDRDDIYFLKEGDNAGDPIDIAIYVGSYDFKSKVGGNVTVNSNVSMTTNGTMIIDAENVVNTFSDEFENSPAWKNGTNRLEVVSRRTETVDQAVVKGSLPYAMHVRRDAIPPWFKGKQYVLRGKPVAEVLAKVGSVPLVPPLPEELEGSDTIEETDTEELMFWLEKEGIAPYLAEAYPPTLSTDIDLIKAAKRLRDYDTILKETKNDQINILTQILDDHMQDPINIAQIKQHRVRAWHRDDAVMDVLTGKWISALVGYVQTLNNEFGYPSGLSIDYVMTKYIERTLTNFEAQDLIEDLLNYIQISTNGLYSGLSVYWTEDST